MEQHGLLSAASTTLLLLDCLIGWTSALNEGKSVDLIYFDLSKAFDKVHHVKLLQKLKHLVVAGNLLQWVESYLHKMYSTFKVGNSFSECHPCSSGVPQGGMLSPLLFLAYTFYLPCLQMT